MFKLILFSALLCSPVTAAGRFSGEVQSSTDIYGAPSRPILALKQALQKHPRAKRFNIDWGMALTHGSNSGQLIYDQQQQVLWVSYSDQGYVDSDDHYLYHVTETSQQWHFSGVTLNRLRLLFARYRNKNYGDSGFGDAAFAVSFYPRLTEFGARGGLVGRTAKHWRRKKQ